MLSQSTTSTNRPIMSIRALTVLLSTLLLISGVACADEAAIRSGIYKKFPKANDEIVTRTPHLGLYELVVDGQLVYTDEDFNYLIDGSIIDTKSMTNVTAVRQRDLEELKLKKLAFPFENMPFELAIKKVKGVFRSGLSVLQAARARPRQGGQRYHLCLPLPVGRVASESTGSCACDLVFGRARQGLGRIHAQGRNTESSRHLRQPRGQAGGIRQIQADFRYAHDFLCGWKTCSRGDSGRPD